MFCSTKASLVVRLCLYYCDAKRSSPNMVSHRTFKRFGTKASQTPTTTIQWLVSLIGKLEAQEKSNNRFGALHPV
jgi:hypothetical protein